MALSRSKLDVIERRSYLIDDLAVRLKVSRTTIEREIVRRQVVVIRVGRSVRIPESEVEKILRSSVDKEPN